MSKVFYGIENNMIDVTETALKNCLDSNGTFTLPECVYQKANLLGGDFLPGVNKNIYIKNTDGSTDFYGYQDLITIENFSAPAPALAPAPIVEPESVLQPEPVVEHEPVVEPESVLQPEPVVEPESVAEAEPVVEPGPVVEPEPVVEAVPQL
jgi:hypothetical protein